MTTGPALPPRLAGAIAKVKRELEFKNQIINVLRIGLVNIREGGVHHPECIMERCRNGCPVRKAMECLAAVPR